MASISSVFVQEPTSDVAGAVSQAYGKTTFLITNLSKVPRGTEGAISLEGTAAGAAAALGFSAIAIALGQVSGSCCMPYRNDDRSLLCSGFTKVMSAAMSLAGDTERRVHHNSSSDRGQSI